MNLKSHYVFVARSLWTIRRKGVKAQLREHIHSHRRERQFQQSIVVTEWRQRIYAHL